MIHSKVGVTAVVMIALAASTTAQDWPQWRGPVRDGAIRPFASRPRGRRRSPSGGRWTLDGYATPLIVGERVYVFTRQSEER